MDNIFFKYFEKTAYVYKILGIVNFSNTTFCKSAVNYLWSLPLNLVYYYSLWKTYELCLKNRDEALTRSKFNPSYFLFFIATVHMILRLWYSNKKDVIRLLEKIDVLNCTLNLKRVCEMRRFFIMFIVCLLIHYLCVFTISTFNLREYGAFYVTSLSINSLATFIEAFFVYQTVHAVHKQFVTINRSLFQHFNPRSGDVIPNMTNEMEKIAQIAVIHYKITKVARLCNHIFNLPIISSCAFTFIFLTTDLYYTFSIILPEFRNEQPNYFAPFLLLCNVMWTVEHCIQFVFIILPWRGMLTEAKKTATYIHDIWNKYANANAVDANINHLQLISLQLLNTKLEFTAYGFFSLDWTLLHAIISAVTTYVVILIQFETT